MGQTAPACSRACRISTLTTAESAFRRHADLHALTDYRGILSLHAFARLALISRQPRLLDGCRRYLLPFVRGQVDFPRVNFANYTCGGNGTAFLYWHGKLPEAEEGVREHAEALMNDAPRDREGIYCHPRYPGEERIWIDVAFAVTPFLLFAGLAFGEDAYIEEGFQQIAKMYHILRDPENGLLHQCRGFAAPAKLSQDHWSRGNGWGLLALTELVNYLPDHDPRRPRAEGMFRDLVYACLPFQDTNGVWHQELTDHTAYVETSGTGLILYAMGVGLEKGLFPSEVQEDLVKGLRGYMAYIQPDGSVYHTCMGCLCPGQGTILDYKARAPVLNDPHAFGPVTLAFGQALNLGIHTL